MENERFDGYDLNEFLEILSEEDKRAISENLDEETLAIFDLLKKENLNKKEEDSVKKVARKTLAKLKEEKLKIARWRESMQITAQVKTVIFDSLQYLPQEAYTDEEVTKKSDVVYQHIFTNYYGGGRSVYTQAMAN